MDKREQRIYLETARHRIAGTITLSKDGYRSRVSDVLNASERDFISLTDVTVELVDGEGPGTHHDYLTVSRAHIVLVIPDLVEDDQLEPARAQLPPVADQ